MNHDVLLEARGIGRDYPVKSSGLFAKSHRLVAVDHVDIEVRTGETLGLVGESGCGKSTVARMLCRLEEPSRGTIIYKGQPLSEMRGETLRCMRHAFQPVFQDPFGSLNPRLTIRQTLIEPMQLQQKKASSLGLVDLLSQVGLGEELLDRYAHQLSGGQRQRVVLARALALKPELLIADEPVSSLDVSIQAQILNLFMDLQQRLKLTLIFISHDLRVISHVANRVAVMYMGRIMEMAPVKALFEQPQHPYTWALLAALPRLEPGRGRKRALLKGEIPTPVDPQPGCRFYSRCAFHQAACQKYENQLISITPDHFTACQRYQEISKP